MNIPMRRTKLTAFALVLLGILIAVGWWKKHSAVTSPPRRERVSFRMKWFFAGTMTPYFAAKERGLFERRGIEIEIRPGGPENSSIKLVAAGSDQFGITGADELLLARSKGIPIVAIGVVFKRNPVVYLSKKTSGITSPKEFVGKTVALIFGENSEIQYRAMLRNAGVDSRNIREIPGTFDLTPFVTGKVDVIPAYAMDQAVTLRRIGIDVNEISPSDYGMSSYGDVIFTTEQLIREKPDLVRRFLAACHEGWRWSLDHPDEAVSYLLRADPTMKRESQLAVFQATKPYFLYGVASNRNLLKMEQSRWEQTETPLVDFQLLKSKLNLKEAYSNEYLQ